MDSEICLWCVWGRVGKGLFVDQTKLALTGLEVMERTVYGPTIIMPSPTIIHFARWASKWMSAANGLLTYLTNELWEAHWTHCTNTCRLWHPLLYCCPGKQHHLKMWHGAITTTTKHSKLYTISLDLYAFLSFNSISISNICQFMFLPSP